MQQAENPGAATWQCTLISLKIRLKPNFQNNYATWQF